MERNSFGLLPTVPRGRLNNTSKIKGPPLAQQRLHQNLVWQQDFLEAHADVQTQIGNRVSQQHFEESVMLLRRKMDAQSNTPRPHGRDELLEQAVTNDYGSPLPSPQNFDFNTPFQMPTNGLVTEAKFSALSPTGTSQEHSRLSYVEKQREAQKVHSKAYPGDVRSQIQPHAPQRKRKLWKVVFVGRLARKRRCKAASADISPSHLQNQQITTTTPNWPFGVNPTSRGHNAGWSDQHYPLTTREIQLLLRDPHIRDGNIGPLPTPDGLEYSGLLPHVYGITPEPEETGKVSRLSARRLTGLKRHNAQRKRPKSPIQQDFESLHNQGYDGFRRGRAARDVNVIYASPVDLARRKSVLPQIQEVAYDSVDSDSIHKSEPQEPHTPEPNFDGEPLLEQHQRQEEKDECRRPLGSTTERRASLSAQRTQSGGSEQNEIGPHTANSLRRLSFVIKGPRPAPGSASVSSSTSPTPPSTAQTAEIHVSTLASELQLKPETEPVSRHPAEDGPCAVGCTWSSCSRIRGTFKMPLPDVLAKNKPEHDMDSAAERGNEDDIVSVGNGFGFLRLN